MRNRISSYRLFKWNDVSKAGLANDTRGESNDALNTQWCYSFGLGENTGIDRECVPHHIYEDWPNAAACGSVNYTTSSPNMKTNNEPRNTADDRPQTLDEILNNWESLMRTGQRLCTPSSWDGSSGFNQQFLDSIDARGWRCDILDIHSYWATGSFYSLNGLYQNARRPIWVTEWCWGASWNNNGAFANGVTEAQNGRQELFGEQRLLSALNERKSLSVQETCENVRANVDSFVGGADQFDDITMVCLKLNSLP